ncbi:MAG: glycoside hydrolase family 3 N-terminal domain-containing protein, partial [Pseudomonadales bacterium]
MNRTKTISAFLLAAALIVSMVSVQGAGSRSNIDRLVDEKLASMSVAEKVGQMTQITLGVLRDDEAQDGKSIDPAKLKEAVHKYHIGSVINKIGRSLAVDEWHEVMRKLQDEALSAKNQIPILYGIDAIHGANYTVGSTLFPHNIGLGAARNPDLVADIAAVTAMEVRASGIRWNFAPVLGLGRNPLWSRFEETYGEDSYLAGELGAAAVRAYEQDDLASDVAVASCIKHYIGYSNPVSGKDRTPAYIPDIELWEHYVSPFAKGVESGASTIMLNSGSVNGMPVHGSKRLLTGLLRDELGFDGVIVSDWEDVIRLHTRHRIAESPHEAVRLAVEAGMDMSMVPFDFSFAELLADLVNSGEVSEQRIDESVKRILRLKYELGLFDNAYPERSAAKHFGDPEYRMLALDAARETITLLKNEKGALPLERDTRILLAGPAAQNLGALHSSWSYTWQGADESAYPDDTKTIAEAAIEHFG